MRNEKVFFETIIEMGIKNENIRAAYLKGSRANPNVKKDIFQDFDVVYVVNCVKCFKDDKAWLNNFGKIALIQEQDNCFGYGERFGIRNDYENAYSYLVLFDDGNRLDVGIETKEHMKKSLEGRRLFVKLFDKDNCLPENIMPTDKNFYIKKPDLKTFTDCCTEFWWGLGDVVKGIERDEVPYAMNVYFSSTRDMLETMLEWLIGAQNNFNVTAGKKRKYLKKYLSSEYYDLYLKTFSSGDYENFYMAIDISCQLFHRAAIDFAEKLGYEYNIDEEKAMRLHIEKIRKGLYKYD